MNIIVFLGPSLAINEAKKILPDAMYLPPAAAGDILHVIRLKPKMIAIIDGFFEKKASILHKEILFALESGIAVFGASSMGALRARECQFYGMIGIGKIYEKYFVDCNEDDAVAMLHALSSEEYAPKTIALMDVIFTLEKAVASNIIDKEIASLIEKSARELFYIYRTFENIVEKVKQNSEVNISCFEKWILQNGWVNQKKEDAISLLQYLSTNPEIKKINFCFARSLFFRAHYKNAMCQPFPFDHEDLPIAEKIAIQAKNNGIIYRQLQRISYLLAICFALSKKYVVGVDWGKLDTPQKRFSAIENLMQTQTHSSHLFYLYSLMRLSSEKEYQYYRDQVSSEDKMAEMFLEDSPVKYRVFELCAKLWGLVEHFISNFLPHPKFVQVYSDKFRLKHELLTPDDTMKWLQQNDLTLKTYQDLMTMATRFNYIVMQNNVEVLGILDHEENIWWFGDAMELSGSVISITSSRDLFAGSRATS